MIVTFFNPAKVIIGADSLEYMAQEAVSLGKKTVLIVGRGSLKEAGILDKARNLLVDHGAEVSVFEGVEPEPSWETVKVCVEFVKKESPDVIIGLGGGSVIDVSKAAAGLANKENVEDYQHGKELESPGIPLVTVPSTSGSGAEVTPNAVLLHKDRNVKESFRSPYLFPRVAVIDPVLTTTCPPEITAYGGMDALSHAIEAFVSSVANHITDSLCKEAISLISTHLVKAYMNGSNYKAREALSYGSLLAGMAISNTRLGAVHGISHSVGARYNIPHGLVVALLLPSVVDFNLDAAREKYDKIAMLFGKKKAEDVVLYIRQLLDWLKFPGGLRQLGVKMEDFPDIVRDSMPSGSLKANPKKLSEREVELILKNAL